jgi:hypothetical protein
MSGSQQNAVEDVGAPQAPNIKNIMSPDGTRLIIAAIFTITYVTVIIMLIAQSVFGVFDKDKLIAISSSLLSPLGALVGSIMGFYFGSKQ